MASRAGPQATGRAPATQNCPSQATIPPCEWWSVLQDLSQAKHQGSWKHFPQLSRTCPTEPRYSADHTWKTTPGCAQHQYLILVGCKRTWHCMDDGPCVKEKGTRKQTYLALGPESDHSPGSQDSIRTTGGHLEVYHQQSRFMGMMRAPQVQLLTFNRDPLAYFPLSRVFEKGSGEAAAWRQLLPWTVNPALHRRSCALQSPSPGYTKAR